MEREKYLAYIAYFMQNVGGSAGRSEWRKYLTEAIGSTSFDRVDEEEVKKLARHLYKAYVVHIFAAQPALYLADKLSDKKLESYLADLLATRKKYGVDYDTISTDLSTKAADKFIKANGETKYKSILAKLDLKNSPTVIKAKNAAAREKAKAARLAKGGTPVKKTSTKSKTPVKKSTKTTTKKSPVKKTTAKASTAKASTAKASTAKACNDYNLKELKELAKAKGKTGYSKLNKDDLCKMLKIK